MLVVLIFRLSWKQELKDVNIPSDYSFESGYKAQTYFFCLFCFIFKWTDSLLTNHFFIPICFSKWTRKEEIQNAFLSYEIFWKAPNTTYHFRMDRKFRSSQRRCSIKDISLKIPQYSWEKAFVGVSFFDKNAFLQVCNFIKKRLQHMFPVNVTNM